MTATARSFPELVRRAENELAGAAIVFPAALPRAFHEGIDPGHFHDERARRVFTAAVELADEGAHVDALAVAARLGFAQDQLVHFAAVAATPTAIPDRARLVMEGARRRRLADASRVLKEAASTGDEQLVTQAEQLITRDADREQRYFPAEQLHQEWLDRLDADPASDPVIPLPWWPLNDRLAGGLRPGWLVVLAGWPGMGKSAAADMVLDHAAENGHTGTLYMLEMLRGERVDRCVARYSGVPYWKLARPDRARLLSRGEMAAAVDGIRRLRWGIVEAGGWTKEQVVRHVRWHRPSLAVVDLVNEFPAPRTEDKEELARYFSQAAKDLGVCIVAVAHLNRNRLDSRGIKPRPVPADLLGTSAWEQKADVILFVHRDQDVDDDGAVRESPDGELFLGKARGGEKDGVRAVFDGKRMTWRLAA